MICSCYGYVFEMSLYLHTVVLFVILYMFQGFSLSYTNWLRLLNQFSLYNDSKALMRCLQ